MRAHMRARLWRSLASPSLGLSVVIPGTNLGIGIQSADFWAAAVALQLRRIESHQKELQASIATPPASPDEAYARHEYFGELLGLDLRVDAYMLVLAAKHVRDYAGIYASHLHDTVLDDAIKAFEKTVPNAKRVHDILEHWDDYIVGDGRLGLLPDESEWVPVEFEDPEDLVGELVLNAGGYKVRLKELGRAAIVLAEEAVRAFWIRSRAAK